jgi:hypothetical protein
MPNWSGFNFIEPASLFRHGFLLYSRLSSSISACAYVTPLLRKVGRTEMSSELCVRFGVPNSSELEPINFMVAGHIQLEELRLAVVLGETR